MPVVASLQVPALLLAAGAAIAVFRFKAGMIPTLAVTSVIGVALYLSGTIQ